MCSPASKALWSSIFLSYCSQYIWIIWIFLPNFKLELSAVLKQISSSRLVLVVKRMWSRPPLLLPWPWMQLLASVSLHRLCLWTSVSTPRSLDSPAADSRFAPNLFSSYGLQFKSFHTFLRDCFVKSELSAKLMTRWHQSTSSGRMTTLPSPSCPSLKDKGPRALWGTPAGCGTRHAQPHVIQ